MGRELRKGFRRAEKSLVELSLSVLVYPDYTQPFILTTDASNEAIACAFSG